MAKQLTREASLLRKGAAPSSAWAFFNGEFVRIADAKISDITLEMLRKCNYHEDAYIRPLAYKSSPLIGVRLHDLEDGFTVFAVPFGTYIDVDRGISCCISSWRRTDDNAIPARSKITGSYVNAAVSKTEAQLNGYDEAIV